MSRVDGPSKEGDCPGLSLRFPWLTCAPHNRGICFMPALWVLLLSICFQSPVPVVRADDAGTIGAYSPAPVTFVPHPEDETFHLHDYLTPHLFDWYSELSFVYLNRTLSDVSVGYHLGAIESIGPGASYQDVNPFDNRVVATSDMDVGSQPGLRFLVGRTIWADPCDDRGCVAKPNDAPDVMRRLSVELGYLGLLHQHQSTVRYQANPLTPNGTLASRFANRNVGDMYQPTLYPFDYATLNTLTYRSRFDSAELNLRYSTQANNRMPVDMLAGVRYMKLQENFDFFAANTGPSLPGLINAAPTGLYSTRTDNDMIGLQVGGDLSLRLNSHWSLMGRGRGGLLVNSASQRSNLNGTLVATSSPFSDSGTGSGVGMASLFEFGLHTNLQINDPLSLMFGYQGLYLNDLSTAPRQFQWNSDMGGRNTLDRNGSLFFFGPAAGIEWRW